MAWPGRKRKAVETATANNYGADNAIEDMQPTGMVPAEVAGGAYGQVMSPMPETPQTPYAVPEVAGLPQVASPTTTESLHKGQTTAAPIETSSHNLGAEVSPVDAMSLGSTAMTTGTAEASPSLQEKPAEIAPSASIAAIESAHNNASRISDVIAPAPRPAAVTPNILLAPERPLSVVPAVVEAAPVASPLPEVQPTIPEPLKIPIASAMSPVVPEAAHTPIYVETGNTADKTNEIVPTNVIPITTGLPQPSPVGTVHRPESFSSHELAA